MGQLIDFNLHRARRRPADSEPQPGPPLRGDEEATFLFDPLAPLVHLSVERIDRALPATRWHPVDSGLTLDDPVGRERAERRARELGLRIVWPETVTDLAAPRRVALAAALSGHGAAYALALGRLTFSGGFDPGELTTLLEAGTAAGMDAGGVCRAALDESLDVPLASAHTLDDDTGPAELPALRVGGRLFAGEPQLAAALALVRASRAAVASHA